MSEGRKRAANILILLGVLAWLPYLYLLANGNTPSILPFLALHLSGVLGGGYLRSKNAEPRELERGRSRKVIARIMIILGVLAWAPYFYITRILEIDQAIGPFLAGHLTGVLGGSAVRLSIEIEKLLTKES